MVVDSLRVVILNDSSESFSARISHLREEGVIASYETSIGNPIVGFRNSTPYGINLQVESLDGAATMLTLMPGTTMMTLSRSDPFTDQEVASIIGYIPPETEDGPKAKEGADHDHASGEAVHAAEHIVVEGIVDLTIHEIAHLAEIAWLSTGVGFAIGIVGGMASDNPGVPAYATEDSPLDLGDVDDPAFNPVDLGDVDDPAFNPVDLGDVDDPAFNPVDLGDVDDPAFNPVDLGDVDDPGFVPPPDDSSSPSENTDSGESDAPETTGTSDTDDPWP